MQDNTTDPLDFLNEDPIVKEPAPTKTRKKSSPAKKKVGSKKTGSKKTATRKRAVKKAATTSAKVTPEQSEVKSLDAPTKVSPELDAPETPLRGTTETLSLDKDVGFEHVTPEGVGGGAEGGDIPELVTAEKPFSSSEETLDLVRDVPSTPPAPAVPYEAPKVAKPKPSRKRHYGTTYRQHRLNK